MKNFFWVDAFSSKQFGGNPCAVFLDCEGLKKPEMQNLAKEINLSETAFVFSSDKADFSARYFTPDEELPFAGHPTLSVVHAMIESKRLNLSAQSKKIRIELASGIVEAFYEINNGVSLVSIVGKVPVFKRKYDQQTCQRIFGLTSDDFIKDIPIQTVDAGLPVLMVPVADLRALKKVSFADPRAYLEFKKTGDFLFPHFFCCSGPDGAEGTFARSLFEAPSNREDPFTGSASLCMAAFLWKYKLISELEFYAYQGHWIERPSSAKLTILEKNGSIESLKISGAVRTIFSGNIELNR